MRVVVHIGCQFELLLKYSGAATVFQKDMKYSSTVVLPLFVFCTSKLLSSSVSHTLLSCKMFTGSVGVE